MIAVLILAAILAAGRLAWHWGQRQNARPIEGGAWQ